MSAEIKKRLTVKDESDDFIRYVKNLGAKIVFSCHITEKGLPFVFVGKFPSNRKALIKILENFIEQIKAQSK